MYSFLVSTVLSKNAVMAQPHKIEKLSGWGGSEESL